MDVILRLPETALAAIFVVVAVAVIEAGYRFGKHTRRHLPKEDRAVVDTIYSAILGVVALLLGFTFAMAANRFDARRQLVLDEANAISTAALRADLVDPVVGASMKDCLLRYTDQRLAMVRARADEGARSVANAQAEAIQAEMWGLVRTLSGQDSKAYPNALLTEAINSVFDLYEARNVVRENRVPRAVWALLTGTVLIALSGVGIRCGFADRRLPGTTGLFAVVIGLILMIVIDLDRPYQGLITVSQEAMERVRESLRE